jgi:hypothetical protein
VPKNDKVPPPIFSAVDDESPDFVDNAESVAVTDTVRVSMIVFDAVCDTLLECVGVIDELKVFAGLVDALFDNKALLEAEGEPVAEGDAETVFNADANDVIEVDDENENSPEIVDVIDTDAVCVLKNDALCAEVSETVFFDVCVATAESELDRRAEDDTVGDDVVERDKRGENEEDDDPLSDSIFVSVVDGEEEDVFVAVIDDVIDVDLLVCAVADTLLLTAEVFE